MDPHAFCRALLRSVMKDVRKHVPAAIRKEAWAWRSGRDAEFQIPSKQFYWHGSACCLWLAKYEGWTAYLEMIGVHRLADEED